jgi:hypothetical protein
MGKAKTAAIFEGIVRARAAGKSQADRLVSLYFSKGMPLHEEASAFALVCSTSGLERDIAESAIDETISRLRSNARSAKRERTLLASDASALGVKRGSSPIVEEFDRLLDAIDEGAAGVVALASSRKAIIEHVSRKPEQKRKPVSLDESILKVAQKKFDRRHGERAPLLRDWAAGSPEYAKRAKQVLCEATAAIEEYAKTDDARIDADVARKLSDVREIAQKLNVEDRGSIADVLLLADLTKEIRG